MACSWMGVGVVKPADFTPARILGSRANSSKVILYAPKLYQAENYSLPISIIISNIITLGAAFM
jgi:hypothetical protein